MLAPKTTDALDGIDFSDEPIHIEIEGTLRAYCDADLALAGYMPPAEVTEPSWCRECVAAQDGVA